MGAAMSMALLFMLAAMLILYWLLLNRFEQRRRQP
jgi:preprotein translocase subunit YajC